MGHYKANLRDIEFMLFEVLDRQSVLGQAPYADLDEDTARGILTEVERLATHELADSLLEVRPHPPVYDPATADRHDARVVPASYGPTATRGGGTSTCPPSSAASPSRRRCAGRSRRWCSAPTRRCTCTPRGAAFAARALRASAPRSRSGWAKTWVDSSWGATMVLTEPDAGSDVGAGRTRAMPQADGRWHIEGVKRFITNGEHDLEENIVHLVLARPEGVPGPAGPAPRASRCSSSRSSSSTGRPASWASATASAPPTSSTRWACAPRRPAS